MTDTDLREALAASLRTILGNGGSTGPYAWDLDQSDYEPDPDRLATLLIEALPTLTLASPDTGRDAGLDEERRKDAMYGVWPSHIEGTGGTGVDHPQTSWRVLDPAVLTLHLIDAILGEYARLTESPATPDAER